MQKNFGKKLNEKLSVNDELFYKKIMSYVNDQNDFRKKMPGIFRGGAYDVGQEVETAIRDNFKQVPVGSKIRNSNRSISPSERSLERN